MGAWLKLDMQCYEAIRESAGYPKLGVKWPVSPCPPSFVSMTGRGALQILLRMISGQDSLCVPAAASMIAAVTQGCLVLRLVCKSNQDASVNPGPQFSFLGAGSNDSCAGGGRSSLCCTIVASCASVSCFVRCREAPRHELPCRNFRTDKPRRTIRATTRGEQGFALVLRLSERKRVG